MSDTKLLSSAEEIIEDARNGRMFILVDDEDRENEGDLIIPGQMATPQSINFMATHGRGLICLALAPERVEKLGLPLMSRDNQTRHQTAFTVSIEATEGVTTGISASDRAHTINVAIDPTKGKDDIRSPGHVFPLVAREGGVLVRAGHTEAAVDVARLAGLYPAGVICEIMNEDGSMARLPELVVFARRHGLKLGTIADLIAYRRRHDRIIERTVEETIFSRHGGEFSMVVYVNKAAYAEHVALVKGDVTTAEPVLVRMHAANIMDVIGERRAHGQDLQESMKMVADAGRGVIVVLREPRATSLSDLIAARRSGGKGEPGGLRDIGVGAQILHDLGVRDMILLSNTKRAIVGLEGFGLRVVEQRPIPLPE